MTEDQIIDTPDEPERTLLDEPIDIEGRQL